MGSPSGAMVRGERSTPAGLSLPNPPQPPGAASSSFLCSGTHVSSRPALCRLLGRPHLSSSFLSPFSVTSLPVHFPWCRGSHILSSHSPSPHLHPHLSLPAHCLFLWVSGWPFLLQGGLPRARTALVFPMQLSDQDSLPACLPVCPVPWAAFLVSLVCPGTAGPYLPTGHPWGPAATSVFLGPGEGCGGEGRT